MFFLDASTFKNYKSVCNYHLNCDRIYLINEIHNLFSLQSLCILEPDVTHLDFPFSRLILL